MHRPFYYILIFLLILGDIFLFRESSDIRIFGLVFAYLFFSIFLKLKSKETFLFALAFLVGAYIQFLFSNRAYFLNPETAAPPSERLAVWTFLFLVIGIIQKWRE